MKNFLLLFSFLSLSGFYTWAQNPNFQNRSPEEMANRQTQVMKDSLGLSEEQVPKIQAINLKYAQKMKELWAGEGDQASKFQDFQVLQGNREYELKKILTKEQAKLFTKMQERNRARMQERRQRASEN